MRNHKHSVKAGKPNPPNQPQRKLENAVRGKPVPRRWSIVALCLLVAAGGTWALFEFVVWSKLPAALVGKWEVAEGPQRGAIFDFSRNGRLQAFLNSPDPNKMNVMQAAVAVEDKTLLITTRNPHTGQDETRSCVMRELTPNSLIVEFDNGEVFKMARTR